MARFPWQVYRGIFYRLSLSDRHGWRWETKRLENGPVYEHNHESFYLGDEADASVKVHIDAALDYRPEPVDLSEF